MINILVSVMKDVTPWYNFRQHQDSDVADHKRSMNNCYENFGKFQKNSRGNVHI